MGPIDDDIEQTTVIGAYCIIVVHKLVDRKRSVATTNNMCDRFVYFVILIDFCIDIDKSPAFFDWFSIHQY